MDDQERQRNNLDKANDLLSTLQNLRFLGQAGRFLAQRAAAGILAATSEIWGPIIVGVVIFIGVFTLVLLINQQPAAGGPASSPSPTPLSQNLSNYFRVTGASESETQEIYSIFSEAFKSSRYANLLTGGGTINISLGTDPRLKEGWCGDSVFGSIINLYNFFSCEGKGRKYLLLHASGHVLGNRNDRLYQSFPFSDFREKDASCYTPSGFLKTYARGFVAENETRAYNESFAEAIALYLVYQDRAPLTNFPNQCPATYNWVRNNIFQ